MDTQTITPTEPDATPPTPRPSTPLPPHPAFATVVKVRHSQKPLWVVLAVILLIAGIGGVYYWQHQKVTTIQSQLSTAQTSESSLRSQLAKQPSTTPATTKTYTDTAAKASFSYPSNWTLSAIKGFCGDASDGGCSASTDKISAQELTSPSSNLSLVWSGVGGHGGACDNSIPVTAKPTTSNGSDPCALQTVFSATPIAKAKGLYVVEGAVEQSSSVGQFQPFLEVQDSSGTLKTGQFGMSYPYYQLPTITIGTQFNMAGYPDGTITNGVNTTYTNVAQAKSFFASAEAKQAQQILLSLKY